VLHALEPAMLFETIRTASTRSKSGQVRSRSARRALAAHATQERPLQRKHVCSHPDLSEHTCTCRVCVCDVSMCHFLTTVDVA
jgi:hypothetical protein